MTSEQVLLWGAFNLFILVLLALDLGVFHRKPHAIGLKEGLVWSGIWVAVALLFNAFVYFWRGPDPALEFLSGYLIERALSIDNIFVFLLIFSYFAVSAQYQHRVLFWGIIGALVMRGLFIATGITLIEKFHWTIYVFGAFLVFTGIKMAVQKDNEVHPERNPLIRLVRRYLPVLDHFEGGKFLTKSKGRLVATPLFVVLLVVEISDVLFAVDSIPAILSITTDPFIVYSSNVFAILGLRALYFAIAGLMPLFHYLHYGLSAVLVFIGAKMLLTEVYKMPVGPALGVVAGILLASMLASMVRARRTTALEAAESQQEDEPQHARSS